MQYKFCRDVSRCINGTAPTLANLRVEYGEKLAESWLEIQLQDLSEFSGCKDKLSIEQIEQTARVINVEFYYLKVTELMLFFFRFKAGKYGRFYGAVDGLVITTALQDFLQYRAQEIDKYKEYQRKSESEAQARDEAKHVMTYEEYNELKWLFNMGYERENFTPVEELDSIYRHICEYISNHNNNI